MKICYSKYAFALFLLIILASDALAQKKLIKKIFSSEKDSTRSSSFLPLPAIGYSQETGFMFGVITLYSFYTDRQDTLTRNSTITGLATYTTKKQSGFQLKADVWTPGNNIHHITEVRYKNFPFSFYGIGSNTREADQQSVIQKTFRLGGEIEKKFGKASYTGINASFDNYEFNYKDELTDLSNPLTFPGKEGGKVIFLGLSQIVDSRNSNTYTTKGTFVKVNFSYAPPLFGSEDFEGSLTKMDFRTFKSFNAKTVLGFNANYQTLQGSKAPFYLMPQLGNDNIMRGYYSGRYREQNLLAAQAELRYRFSPRLGIAGFAGTGTVYSKGNFAVANLKPSYGGGFRYFFDAERGLSVRIDYGVGEKRPGEKRQTGMYISLGEAF